MQHFGSPPTIPTAPSLQRLDEPALLAGLSGEAVRGLDRCASASTLGTSRCENHGNPAFCVELRFPRSAEPCGDHAQQPTFRCTLESFRAAASSASTPASGIAENLVDEWSSAPRAFTCPPANSTQKAFPSKTPDGATCDDRDVMLFAGLLCASGDSQWAHAACEAVAASEDANGEWWRSPRRVGVHSEDSGISNDLDIGVLLYVAKTHDGARLSAWRNFILANAIDYPNSGSNHLKLFRTCAGPASVSCSVFGDSWYLINATSKALGLPDVANPEIAIAFGHDSVWLPFLAGFIPDGYRLHNLAAQILLLQMIGAGDRYTNDAAKILAGRDPENPFYLWLYLRKDKKVQDLTEKYCPQFGAPAHEDRTEWMWERSMSTVTATSPKTMYWECALMGNLLAH